MPPTAVVDLKHYPVTPRAGAPPFYPDRGYFGEAVRFQEDDDTLAFDATRCTFGA
jgi:hypothetical protein